MHASEAESRMPRPGVVVAFVALALFVALLAPAAAADVVHLRTGEAVKGRPIQSASTDKYVLVEDYLTGAFRRFAWDALDPADEKRIKEDWDWEQTSDKTVMGESIEVRLGDGTVTEERGLVESETDTVIKLRKDGRVVEIPKHRVVGRHPEELDIRDVWSPSQLVEQMLEGLRKKGLDPDNLEPRDSWSLAVYAEWVADLETAKTHYTKCASNEEYFQRDLARERLARVEALLLDAAAWQTLRTARLKLGMSLFKKVRAILDEFPQNHPDASEAVLRKLEQFKADFEERRTAKLQLVARRKFVKIVQDLISAKIREKDLAITDVTSWTRRELPEAAFLRLALKAMARFDDVTPEQAKILWEGRGEKPSDLAKPKEPEEADEAALEGEEKEKPRLRLPWKRVTYGGGTFIVYPPKIKPPKARRGGRSSGRGGGGAKVEIPKPPTRDQWWQKAKIREREQWVLSYFVERSELFEVGDHEYRPCPMCHAVGLLSKTLQTGETLSYLCTRCGGAQHDVIVKFR